MKITNKNKEFYIPKDFSGFKETPFKVNYSKEQMIEFAIYCSGHRKHMIENRFKEFENKKP